MLFLFFKVRMIKFIKVISFQTFFEKQNKCKFSYINRQQIKCYFMLHKTGGIPALSGGGEHTAGTV